MPRKIFNISVPPKVVAEFDELRGDETRSGLITRLMIQHIRKVKKNVSGDR